MLSEFVRRFLCPSAFIQEANPSMLNPRQQEKIAFRYGFHKYNSNKEPLLISMVSFYLRKNPILPELKRLF